MQVAWNQIEDIVPEYSNFTTDNELQQASSSAAFMKISCNIKILHQPWIFNKLVSNSQ